MLSGTLEQVNWRETHPYKPSVEFSLDLGEEALNIAYRVREKTTAARVAQDGGPVWEDSCCEFFCSFDDSGYYNLEANCIGRLKFAFGADRNARRDAPGEALKAITRCASAGENPFDERHSDCWELALTVPFRAFFAHSINRGSFARMRFNIYKCGDRLTAPHYISFAPVGTPKPDFHRPEFFVPADFQRL